ncbi:MAG: lamin tail domain-containing protein [Sedimentisphaerales bacterium]|nr:lamin tail domain-containing protein [Sedimentisphaerales bacterium]
MLRQQWLTLGAPGEGLAAHWPLNEQTGSLASERIGGYDGLLQNGPFWQPDGGRLDGALVLDGIDDYVTVAEYNGIGQDAPRTITAWVKTPGSDASQTIVSWGQAATGNKWLLLIDAGVETGLLKLGVWGGFVIGSTPIADNRWHHVAAVFYGIQDGRTGNVSEAELYVNGQKEVISQQASLPVQTTTNENVLLGVYRDQDGIMRSFFDGRLDDIRIYNRPLSGQEIQVLAALGGPSAGGADLDGIQGVGMGDFARLASHWRQTRIPLAINEVMASNDEYLTDPQGDHDDWIELYNAGSVPIDVAGMYLTDDLDSPRKWRFPAGHPQLTTLAAGDHLVIWMDGDTQDFPNGLHAGFALDADGDEIALLDPNGQVVIDWIRFGNQKADMSYGRLADGDNDLLFFAAPSANGPNGGRTFRGLVADTKFSADRGFYQTSVPLTLSTATEGAVIRYTLDGSTPTETSGYVFSGPTWRPQDGKHDGALELDGRDDFMEVAGWKGITGSQSRTVAAWIQTTKTGEIISWGDTSGPGRKWWLSVQDEDAVGSLKLGVWYGSIIGTTNIRDGQWHHVAAVLEDDGTANVDEVRLYVDGTLEEISNVYPQAIDTAAGTNVLLGTSELAWQFAGLLDDVCLYDLALSSEEIAALAALAVPPAAGLVAYWKMDESAGTTAADSAAEHPGQLRHQIVINETSMVRAAAFKAKWLPTDVDTHTYIFVSDVQYQSFQGLPPGAGWPGGNVNGQVIDYGMDPQIFNNPLYGDQLEDALLAIPSVSIVTDLPNLFDPATGIYVNAWQDGPNWERPASLELIRPDGQEGFQINMGLRIRGGYSRDGNNPKHAFRVLFRKEYGAGKLRYPLFEDEGVAEFDNIDFRTSQNYSWSFDGGLGQHNTFTREVFCRDMQREMGQPYTRSRYYHLYLNGQYWGLYQSQERSEASYAESYLGGDKDDYDVVKVDRELGYQIAVTDGTLSAYYRLWQACNTGFASNQAYYAVQGQNTDGSVNPAYERLVDVDNLIDEMLCVFYAGDYDGPVSNFLGNDRPNNYYAIYNRNQPDGFKFFRHDCEHTLNSRNGWGYDRTGPYPAGSQFVYFNPQWLHQRMAVHLEYRVRLGDRAHRYLFNNGILTPDQAKNRFWQRARTIETAIVAESARWGDAKVHPPFTQADWQQEIDYVMNNSSSAYSLPRRTQLIIDQLKAKGWYPNVAAPVFYIDGQYQHGGHVALGQELSMQNPQGSGTIYYTVDGADPRLRGGGINPAASIFGQTGMPTVIGLVAEGATKKILVPASYVSTDWRGGNEPFDDSGWTPASGTPGGIGYEINPGDATNYAGLIHPNLDTESRMYYLGSSGTPNTSCLIRIPFVLTADPAQVSQLTLKVRYDDGFVAYLNGTFLERANFEGNPSWDSDADDLHDDEDAVQWESFPITDPDKLAALHAGQNLLAIHGLNISTTSSDFLIAAELEATLLPEEVNGIELAHSATVKARLRDPAEGWSALNEAVYAVGPVADNLRISEIMYHPTDEAAEFIELTNIGDAAINLALVRFDRGIHFSFAPLILEPNRFVLVVQDADAFAAAYPAFDGVIAGQYTGALDNGGERIELVDAAGRVIHDFSYDDDWYEITDGHGFSLIKCDPAGSDPNNWDTKSGWRPSAAVGGSPGADEAELILPDNAVVINELLANSPSGGDWLELYNTTEEPIHIGGWFLSDDDDDLRKYQIATGTILDSGRYLVLYEDPNFGDFGDPGSQTPFALSDTGETVYLTSGAGGQLTGWYQTQEDFGASLPDVAFGRHIKSALDGGVNFVAMSRNTPGGQNAYPKVGPIVINEIAYHPDTNGDAEYVELLNIGDTAVTFYDSVSHEPWRFVDDADDPTPGLDYRFPAMDPVELGPGHYLLLVKDLAAFTSVFSSPPDGVQVLEWGSGGGSLNNGGEKLELQIPGTPQEPAPLPYIRLDRVNYDDQAPWPTDPDGSDIHVLSRKVPDQYGNDAINWESASPSPGSDNP